MDDEYENKLLRGKGVIPYFYKEFIVPAVKRIRGNKCELCPSDKYIDVHHLDYNKLTIDWFQLLCRRCHRRIHPVG